MKTSFIVGILCLSFAVSLAMADISIDGDLSDWGITLGNWGTYGVGVQAYIDSPRSGDFVDPGYGGSLYDAYAMYFTYDDTNAYVAFVSGFPQEGRAHSTAPGGFFYPGDLAFNFGGNWEYGVRLNTNESLRSGVGDYKGIYRVTDWQEPYEGSTTYAGYFNSSFPTVINATSQNLGQANLFYSGNKGTADPWYVVEVAIPRNTTGFSWEDGFTIHWTQTCGNDALDLNIPQGTVPPVPEPVSVSLFLLGAGALGLKLFHRMEKE